MYKHILIPTDGSEVAEKAVAQGIEFAREAKARVTLFTAVPEYEPPSEAQVFARRVVSIADHARESEETAKRILAEEQASTGASVKDYIDSRANEMRRAAAMTLTARIAGSIATVQLTP